MILVINVGNTDMIVAAFEGEEVAASWRMTTSAMKTSDEIGSSIMRFFEFDGINPEDIKDVVISSVVPNVMYSLTNAVKKYFLMQPIIIDSSIRCGIDLSRMRNPQEIGNNRLVNLAAAYHIYGGPVMVVDYSTCTTYDVVDEHGVFVTGITSPGINICTESLFVKAAQLPQIEIKKPDSIYCQDIVSCIQGGIYYGHRGEAKYIINSIKEEMGIEKLTVVATGGLARVIDDKGEFFDIIDPYLSFKGLRFIYEQNKNLREGNKKCSL